MCEVIFMAVIKKAKNKILSGIRSELCRMDVRFVIAGAVIILVCGFLSAITSGGTSLYGEIELPSFAPPAIVFPIAWTILYALIGGAAGAIAGVRDKCAEADKYKGLLFFVIMMVFNFVWSPLFFGARAFVAAFAAIIMMIILTFFIIVFFSRIFKITALAMAVYLLWLFFAAYLNLAVIILN